MLGQVKLSVVTVLLVVFAAGCASVEPRFTSAGFDPSTVRKPDPHETAVWIVEKRLVVDQEPVRLPKGAQGRERKVNWTLEDGATSRFRDDSSIKFEQKSGVPQQPVCRLHNLRKRMECTFKNNGPATWKYTLNVEGAQDPLDPYVVQE